jgi:hypothetical protein
MRLSIGFGALILAGCARHFSPSSTAACSEPPKRALVPFAPVQAVALSGNYELVVVAQTGPGRGRTAVGPLHLEETDTLHRYYVHVFEGPWHRYGDHPLRGWTRLAGDIGLATAGIPLDSRDSTLPGVVSSLDSVRAGLVLMLGYRPMLDGGYNEFSVTRELGDGFAGRWTSSLGYTNYEAAGYFCAFKKKSSD